MEMENGSLAVKDGRIFSIFILIRIITITILYVYLCSKFIWIVNKTQLFTVNTLHTNHSHLPCFQFSVAIQYYYECKECILCSHYACTYIFKRDLSTNTTDCSYDDDGLDKQVG